MSKKMLIFIFIIFFTSIVKTNAIELVDKDKLPYEIMSIDIENESISIKGWGFVNRLQHFLNDNTHSYQIEFRSKHHNFTVDAKQWYSKQTDLVKFAGTSRCRENQYFMYSDQCYYDYEYVGFDAKIPLSSFQIDTQYTTYLIIHGKQTNQSFKIALYFPMSEMINKNIHGVEYRIASKMNDTSLMVNHTTVLVRNGPSKTAGVMYAGDSCSTSFKNKLYYEEATTYDTIFQKQKNSDVHFYQIKGQTSGCLNQRRRVKEGNVIFPMWIASTFVSYTGTPLQIIVETINTPPVLTILKHPYITKGEELNPYDYMQATDKEDGDLTDKIHLISGNYDNLIAKEYILIYKVIDSGGLSDEKKMFVTVMDKNYPPVIAAYDRTVAQYDPFNPMIGVYANDYEDGDLTNSIVVLNTIDTSILETQELCYWVSDSSDATATKCINVMIQPKIMTHMRIRYIQKSNLFYKQNTPQIWIDSYESLLKEIHNPYHYLNDIISK